MNLNPRSYWLLGGVLMIALAVAGAAEVRRHAASAAPGASDSTPLSDAGAGAGESNYAASQPASTNSAPETGSTQPSAAPSVALLSVPAGTSVEVRLDESLSSNQSRPGEEFPATITEPIAVDGSTVIPAGAHATGRVVVARPSGHLRGVAELGLTLESVELNGQSFSLDTAPHYLSGGNHKKHDLLWIGGGGGSGALIGALAAGGRGAAIGGPVGLGAGLAGAYFTGKKNVRIPAETPMRFELREPAQVPAGS